MTAPVATPRPLWRRGVDGVPAAALSWSVVVPALAVVASVASAVIVLSGDVWSLSPAPQVLVDAAVGVGFSVLAAVITLAEVPPGVRVLARVMLVSGVAAGLAGLSTALALVLPASVWATPVLVQLQGWLWVPGFFPLLTLVPLLYPDGLLAGRFWRVSAWAAVVGIVLLTVGVGLYPEPFAGRVPVDKPVTSETVARVLTVPGAALVAPSLVAGLVALGLRLVRSRGVARQQVGVLLVPAGLLLLVTLAQGAIPAPWNVLAQMVAVLLLPLAIGVAVTRHGLYDTDLAVRRGLLGASLAVCLAGLFVTVLAVLRGLLGSDSAVSAAVAAGAAGLVLQPLAKRLSAGIDRLYYGDRADPYAVLSRLGEDLAAAGLDVAEIPSVVCRSVVSSLRLGGASVVLDVEGDSREVAHAGGVVGGDSARVATFDLRHRGEVVGRLSVAPRSGERVVGTRDAEILRRVADQVAPALAALQLHQELQRSRESLVNAREEERRRLRRELHDGLGATLAGVRLQVESAHRLVEQPTAAGLLDTTEAGLAQAVAEVRHICEGLRPPGVDDLGLGRAIELAADRVRAPRLEVSVVTVDLPEVGPAAEAAAYRIVTEALANVVRHSGARHVTVRLSGGGRMEGAGRGLEVTVEDDGDGIRDGAVAGVGLASMRRRAEELGGTFAVGVGAVGRGTCVRAVLPVTGVGS
ncbi:histidine kinase [Knoellia flava TL1]|nr:GAF domain-containing sensor histidine kinase [Knoellia flava]KGN35200.1 histidine kinase [Knoellia flava TL1]